MVQQLLDLLADMAEGSLKLIPKEAIPMEFDCWGYEDDEDDEADEDTEPNEELARLRKALYDVLGEEEAESLLCKIRGIYDASFFKASIDTTIRLADGTITKSIEFDAE